MNLGRIWVCAMAVAVAFLSSGPSPEPSPNSSWINVMAYGAKGDGRADDTAAILKAIEAAIRQSGSTVVYFPRPSQAYLIAKGMQLPPTRSKWIELYLDGTVWLGGTLEMHNYYYIRGNSGGDAASFATEPTSTMGTGPGASPAILIHRKTNVTLENLNLKYLHKGADGILIDGERQGQSAYVTLRNVHVQMERDNTTGVPLHIKGGFGYYVDFGGYASAAEGDRPSILIEDSVACNNTGIIRMNNVFVSGHGIELYAQCGAINAVTLDGLFYENGKVPLIQIKEKWPGMLYGIRARDCIIADSNVPALDNQSPRTWGVSLDNCSVGGGVLTTGLPISGLEIWHPAPLKGGVKLAQSTGYVLHAPDRVISTVPTVHANEMPSVGALPAEPSKPSPAAPPRKP
jgi:Pectate lyase superfamily protein